jgi:hypothetical protein
MGDKYCVHDESSELAPMEVFSSKVAKFKQFYKYIYTTLASCMTKSMLQPIIHQFLLNSISLACYYRCRLSNTSYLGPPMHLHIIRYKYQKDNENPPTKLHLGARHRAKRRELVTLHPLQFNQIKMGQKGKNALHQANYTLT